MVFALGAYSTCNTHVLYYNNMLKHYLLLPFIWQISEAQLNKVLGYVERGKKSGAKLECGGERLPGKGYFMQPTVFSNVTDDMSIAREEVYLHSVYYWCRGSHVSEMEFSTRHWRLYQLKFIWATRKLILAFWKGCQFSLFSSSYICTLYMYFTFLYFVVNQQNFRLGLIHFACVRAACSPSTSWE